MSEKGLGTKQDRERALEWFQTVAGQDDDPVAQWLARMQLD